MAKILLVNGSPNANGCTATALEEMIRIFDKEGIETELVQVGNLDIPACTGCRSCRQLGKCVMDDIVNEFAAKLEKADGLVIGSPVYYAAPNGVLISFLNRLFFSYGASLQMKVGAAVVSCRRAGSTAALDVLNKYFTISGMPVAPSTYWNQVHGHTPEDVRKDEEGLQTMRNLARNMAFMVKAFADAKDRYALPEEEYTAHTNFADGK